MFGPRLLRVRAPYIPFLAVRSAFHVNAERANRQVTEIQHDEVSGCNFVIVVVCKSESAFVVRGRKCGASVAIEIDL